MFFRPSLCLLFFFAGLGRTAPDPGDTVTLDGVQVPLGKGVHTNIDDTSLLYNEYPLIIVSFEYDFDNCFTKCPHSFHIFLIFYFIIPGLATVASTNTKSLTQTFLFGGALLSCRSRFLHRICEISNILFDVLIDLCFP